VRTVRTEQHSDLRTSSQDLEVRSDEKVIEPLSPDDHIRLHDARARRRREAWRTNAGLAILFVIAVGCFVIFVVSENKDKTNVASQVIVMVVTALVGFLFSQDRSNSS
jgi:hypothetical protein